MFCRKIIKKIIFFFINFIVLLTFLTKFNKRVISCLGSFTIFFNLINPFLIYPEKFQGCDKLFALLVQNTFTISAEHAIDFAAEVVVAAIKTFVSIGSNLVNTFCFFDFLFRFRISILEEVTVLWDQSLRYSSFLYHLFCYQISFQHPWFQQWFAFSKEYYFYLVLAVQKDKSGSFAFTAEKPDLSCVRKAGIGRLQCTDVQSTQIIFTSSIFPKRNGIFSGTRALGFS